MIQRSQGLLLMMNKWLIVLIAFFIGSISKIYAYDFQSDGIYYNVIEGSNVAVTSGDAKYTGDVIIPNKVNHNGSAYNITSIGDRAFSGCSGLTSITIPNSMTSIADWAFQNCSSLTSITIPNSVTSIGSSAFEGCSGLTSIAISNSVTSIGRSAFDNTGWYKKQKDGVLYLDKWLICIKGEKPTGIINIVDGTIGIADWAFSGCSGLTSITIPNSVTSIGLLAFQYCSGLTSITIPNSVTSIGQSAFYGCSSLASIAIPNSITSIADGVFYGCSGLTSITIPNSVTSIGLSAFDNTGWYEKQKDGVLYLDKWLICIKGDKPTGIINIVDGTIGIADWTFSRCSDLTSIIIPTSVTRIGEYAFSYCSGLSSITIPNNVTSIGQSAFYGCSSLASITIPNSITSIADGVFADCSSLISITIPNSVTSVGNYAFSGCSGLTSISIPNSVTSIGISAFYDCHGLTSITIPNSVTRIGEYAFSVFFGSSGLTSVVSEIQKPFEVKENVFFSGTYSAATLTVPKGTKSAYQSTNYWNKFSNIAEATEDDSSTKKTIHVTTAGTLPDLISESEKYTIEELTLTGELNGTDFRLLREMAGGVGVYIPGEGDPYTEGQLKVLDLSDVKIVSGGDAYYTVIERAKYPDEKDAYYYNYLTDSDIIPNELFCDCRQIVSIKLPKSLTRIGGLAFSGCSCLTSITIPNSVTNIGDGAFQGCSSLTSITIPNSVTNIGASVFSNTGWSKNQNDGILYLDEWLIGFKGDKPTGDINIVEGTRGIAGRAFDGCIGLTSIIIPNSVRSIVNYAFFNCSGLKNIISEIRNPFEISENVFSVYSTAKLIVPKGTKSAYQSTNYWNKFSNIVEATEDDSSTKRTIHVATAGTLPDLISDSEKYIIEELTLTGELNGTDFRLLRDMAGCNYLGEKTSGKLTVLDLTNAKIVAGGEKYLDTDRIIGNGINAGGSYHYDISISDVIPDCVFFGCYLKNIHIPNSVTSIGNSAFDFCRGFTSIIIPKSVTSIGNDAFSSCNGLTSVTIPNSVTRIGDRAFSGCSGLTSIKIPNSVTNIGSCVFQYCSGLDSMIVENGNTMYDSRDNCNAIIRKHNNELIIGCRNTVIPNSVTSIGNDAFSRCTSLTSITIPNSVTSIGDFAFYECSGLTSITISNSVTSIGTQTFAGCVGLISIQIPNTVTTIGEGAFNICSGLTSITIPNSVTSIGVYAFANCSGLKTVISEIKTPFEIKENVFSVYSTATLTVPKGTKSAYQSTNYWNMFSTIIEAEGGDVETDVTFSANGITYIGAVSTLTADVQSVDNSLMNVDIPSSVSYEGRTYQVTSIANDALSNRTFNYVSLPSTITSIEVGTFNNSTLGALIWNADASLSSDVFSNMAMPTTSNFLLCVNSKSYAPSNVSNVVIGSTASSITLSDATNTRFYCPKAFTAQTVSYTHNYSMKTGGSGMGWETLALPFDVQKIEHKTKGTLTPFAAYNGSSSQRPFWLYELGSNGFRKTDGIKANTPYIISMPNNTAYDDYYILSGDVTFSATNAKVAETGSITTSTSNGKTFVPAFAVMDPSSSVYALNVVNKLVSNSGSYDAGSRFINNMSVYPFEAYMTSSSGARYLSLEFDADATGIDLIPMKASANSIIEIFAIGGQRIAKVRSDEYQTIWQQLPAGVYIVNSRKVVK